MSTGGRRCLVMWLPLFAVLTGCASLAPPTGSRFGVTQAPSEVAVREHASGRFIELVGIRAQHARPYLGIPDTNFYCLRSFIDRKTDATAQQLYVADSYDGAERHWDAAHDAAGSALRFIPISQMEIACDSGGCAYAEEFAADLPPDELRKNRQGFTITFTDHAKDQKAITVSSAQIAGQLAALGAAQKPAPAPASAARRSAAHQP